jgi:hypothetical protein
MAASKVHLYTICWDERDMLGFFFRHYDPWVSRYVIYDDGSTDGSREILAAHPKVELRTFERTHPDSFVLSHTNLQNTAWKESQRHADWVVITAIDEHLHVQGTAMRDYLQAQAAAGVTYIPAMGFDMNAPEMPEDYGLLTTRITFGRPRSAFNKLGIFNPDAIEDTGFAVGRHAAASVGRLTLPQRDELMLWHYKHLGFERNVTREMIQNTRLGQQDRVNGYGMQYSYSRERMRSFWDEMQATSTDLSSADFVPDQACIRPLWWTERANVSRVRI